MINIIYVPKKFKYNILEELNDTKKIHEKSKDIINNIKNKIKEG